MAKLYRVIGFHTTYDRKLERSTGGRILLPLAEAHPEVRPVPKEGLTLAFMKSLPPSQPKKT
jgi:hypothetical protein